MRPVQVRVEAERDAAGGVEEEDGGVGQVVGPAGHNAADRRVVAADRDAVGAGADPTTAAGAATGTEAIQVTDLRRSIVQGQFEHRSTEREIR